MLSIQGIKKYYKNTVALRNVTLTLKPGEIAGLFGANGAGKTTLLKSVMGLLPYNYGWVTLEDSPIKNEVYEKIAFITEEGSFFPDMTPRDHNDFYTTMLPRFNSPRYVRLLEFFDLDPGKKARTFSKGQRAKLEIAIGMSRGADYILMDEPFVGKDIFTRRDFLKLMISIIKPGEAVLIATHQIEEIEMYITRAVVLHEGEIVGDIATEKLSNNGVGLVDYIKKVCGYEEGKLFDWVEG
jgi:ABC-2 type transport system ATP-binding protein